MINTKRFFVLLVFLFPTLAFGEPFDDAVRTYKSDMNLAITELKKDLGSNKNLANLISDNSEKNMDKIIKSADSARKESDKAFEKNSDTNLPDDGRKLLATPLNDIQLASEKNSNAGVLSTADNTARVAELQKNADAIKAKEQSTENKLLGTAAIGATGIGGMNLASGLAEKKADDDATRAMTAYLATIRCDYGAGQINRGGDADIVLPGANELTLLSAEYIKLARELKTKKEALGLTPGIESEIILDKAGGGLYDNAAMGKTDGAYTSVARALTNTGGTDAAEWAAQRADAESKTKTGAIVAGAGILGGIAGNLAINSGGKDGKNIFGQKVATEKSAEINARYDAMRVALKPIEEKSQKAAVETPPPEQTEEDKVETVSPAPVIPQKPADTKVAQPEPYNGKRLFTLYNTSLFNSGKTELKQPTADLDTAITTIRKEIGADTNYRLKLVGHTDTDKINQNSKLCNPGRICDNDNLSMARAESVKKYLVNADVPADKIETAGAGEKCATAKIKTAKSLDRKVDFYIAFDGEAFPDNLCSRNPSE